MTATITVLAAEPTDRCDRCGARATTLTSHDAGTLAWCDHHLRACRPLAP